MLYLFDPTGVRYVVSSLGTDPTLWNSLFKDYYLYDMVSSIDPNAVQFFVNKIDSTGNVVEFYQQDRGNHFKEIYKEWNDAGLSKDFNLSSIKLMGGSPTVLNGFSFGAIEANDTIYSSQDFNGNATLFETKKTEAVDLYNKAADIFIDYTSAENVDTYIKPHRTFYDTLDSKNSILGIDKVNKTLLPSDTVNIVTKNTINPISSNDKFLYYSTTSDDINVSYNGTDWVIDKNGNISIIPTQSGNPLCGGAIYAKGNIIVNAPGYTFNLDGFLFSSKNLIFKTDTNIKQLSSSEINQLIYANDNTGYFFKVKYESMENNDTVQSKRIAGYQNITVDSWKQD
jgi:hypothetical protein